jgi:hypothetical protein
MKMHTRCQLLAIALGTALYCTACGSSTSKSETEPPKAVPAGNYYIGNKPVYAYLDTGSGGSWIFTTVTESDLQPASGYVVRLNDLAPAFDIRMAECEPQVYPSNHKCSPTHPFREKRVGVIDKIISGGIAAGTAGKVTDFSRNYETFFDEAEFNQAVDEALINTGLDKERQQFIATLDEYSMTLAGAQLELEALAQEASNFILDTSSLPLKLQPTVTGLTAYYTYDIDFLSLVEISPQQTSNTMPGSLDAKAILPCDARNCSVSARNAMASLQENIFDARSAIHSAKSADSPIYDVRCNATTQNGYLFDLQCPEQVQRKGSESIVVPLAVNIMSRDFLGLFPDFLLTDERLSVSISGKSVEFRNLTDRYLSVTAQTLYYNSQVHTAASRIDLAPGVVVNRAISDLVSPAIAIESDYRQMTPDKAAGATFRFGVAAKYRVAGQPEEFTLYDMRTFNVGCTISNRIEFGSCEPAKSQPPVPAAIDTTEHENPGAAPSDSAPDKPE